MLKEFATLLSKEFLGLCWIRGICFVSFRGNGGKREYIVALGENSIGLQFNYSRPVQFAFHYIREEKKKKTIIVERRWRGEREKVYYIVIHVAFETKFPFFTIINTALPHLTFSLFLNHQPHPQLPF